MARTDVERGPVRNDQSGTELHRASPPRCHAPSNAGEWECHLSAYTSGGGGRLSDNTACIKSIISRNRAEAGAALSHVQGGPRAPNRRFCARANPRALRRGDQCFGASSRVSGSLFDSLILSCSPAKIARLVNRSAATIRQ